MFFSSFRSNAAFATAILVCVIFLPLDLAAQSAQAVKVMPLVEIAQSQTRSANARVLSQNDSVLAAQTTAQVAAVNVDAGDAVQKDQVLVQLDSRDAELALAQISAQYDAANARAELAKQRLERAQELAKSKFASADEILALQTELVATQADARVQAAAKNIARRALEKTSIRAPFAGVVVERFAQVGALGTPGAPMLQLAQTSNSELHADLQVDDVATIKVGVEAQFTSQGKQWAVSAVAVSPLARRGSRTYMARFGFKEVAAAIGSSGSVSWQAGGRTLAASFLQKRDGVLGVFTVQGDTAIFVAIADAQEGRAFALDLPGDTLVVTDGAAALIDGASVVISGR